MRPEHPRAESDRVKSRRPPGLLTTVRTSTSASRVRPPARALRDLRPASLAHHTNEPTSGLQSDELRGGHSLETCRQWRECDSRDWPARNPHERSAPLAPPSPAGRARRPSAVPPNIRLRPLSRADALAHSALAPRRVCTDFSTRRPPRAVRAARARPRARWGNRWMGAWGCRHAAARCRGISGR